MSSSSIRSKKFNKYSRIKYDNLSANKIDFNNNSFNGITFKNTGNNINILSDNYKNIAYTRKKNIRIGTAVSVFNTGDATISIGLSNGYCNQDDFSTIIGSESCICNMGSNSFCIGNFNIEDSFGTNSFIIGNNTSYNNNFGPGFFIGNKVNNCIGYENEISSILRESDPDQAAISIIGYRNKIYGVRNIAIGTCNNGGIYRDFNDIIGNRNSVSARSCTVIGNRNNFRESLSVVSFSTIIGSDNFNFNSIVPALTIFNERFFIIGSSNCQNSFNGGHFNCIGNFNNKNGFGVGEIVIGNYNNRNSSINTTKSITIGNYNNNAENSIIIGHGITNTVPDSIILNSTGRSFINSDPDTSKFKILCPFGSNVSNTEPLGRLFYDDFKKRIVYNIK